MKLALILETDITKKVEEDQREVDHAFEMDKERASIFLRQPRAHRRHKRGIIEECKETYWGTTGCSGEEHRETCGYDGCGVGSTGVGQGGGGHKGGLCPPPPTFGQSKCSKFTILLIFCG